MVNAITIHNHGDSFIWGGGKSPKGMRFSQLMDNNKQARQKQMVIQSPLHNVFNRCSLNIKSRFSFS